MKKEKRRVTVKLNRKNWKVESGSCTCPAGNSANCNHVLGLLFEIADYFFTLYDPWKTQALSIEKLSKMQSELQNTAQKMKFSIKDFFSKCDQIRRNWSSQWRTSYFFAVLLTMQLINIVFETTLFLIFQAINRFNNEVCS